MNWLKKLGRRKSKGCDEEKSYDDLKENVGLKSETALKVDVPLKSGSAPVEQKGKRDKKKKHRRARSGTSIEVGNKGQHEKARKKAWKKRLTRRRRRQRQPQQQQQQPILELGHESDSLVYQSQRAGRTGAAKPQLSIPDLKPCRPAKKGLKGEYPVTTPRGPFSPPREGPSLYPLPSCKSHTKNSPFSPPNSAPLRGGSSPFRGGSSPFSPSNSALHHGRRRKVPSKHHLGDSPRTPHMRQSEGVSVFEFRHQGCLDQNHSDSENVYSSRSTPDFSKVDLSKNPVAVSASSWSDKDTEYSTTDPIGGILDMLGDGGFEAMIGEHWELAVEMEGHRQVVVRSPQAHPSASEVAVAAYNQLRELNEEEDDKWPAPQSIQLYDREEGCAYGDDDLLSQSKHGNRMLLLQIAYASKSIEESVHLKSNEPLEAVVDSVRQQFFDNFRSGRHACFPMTAANFKHEGCYDNNVWTEPEASSFNVRSPMYYTTHRKQASQESAYLLLGSELLMAKHGRQCISNDPKGFVARARAKGGDQTPFVFIVNFVLPWANFVAYWSPRNGSTTPYVGDPTFDRTMKRFIEGTDDHRNSRFKLIPRCVQGPWVVRKTANAKPAILGSKLKQTFFEGPGYFEVSIDNASSSGASYILKMIKKYAINIVMDLSYVLQGESDDELPERLIGAMRWYRVDLENAWKYDDWANRPSDM